MSALTQTLLPEPVAPAIEQVGHPGEVDGVRPCRTRPGRGRRSAGWSRPACRRPRSARRKPTTSLTRGWGSRCPPRPCPGWAPRCGCERAASAIARSSARPSMRDSLTCTSGLDLVLGHDRAAVACRRPGPGSAKLRSFSSMMRDVRGVVHRRRRSGAAAGARGASIGGSVQSIAGQRSRRPIALVGQVVGAGRPRRAARGAERRPAGAAWPRGGRGIVARRPAQTVWLIGRGAGLGAGRSSRLLGASPRSSAGRRLAAARRRRPRPAPRRRPRWRVARLAGVRRPAGAVSGRRRRDPAGGPRDRMQERRAADRSKVSSSPTTTMRDAGRRTRRGR